MPAASATSSTLTSSKPRAANMSMATLEMWSEVVERRRPTRCWDTGRMTTPSISALDAILLRPRSHCRDLNATKVLLMEPNQLDGTETGAATAATSGAELVTETLVEEV